MGFVRNLVISAAAGAVWCASCAAGLAAKEMAVSASGLPLPRYVSLKGNVGNARRGPGVTHRIDWVFTHAGMPLRVTAEHENWRRVEDAEGMGGWVHYILLSGVRTARTVRLRQAELRQRSRAPRPSRRPRPA